MSVVLRRLVLTLLVAAALAMPAAFAPEQSVAQVGCNPAYVATDTYCVPWTDYDLNCDDIGWAQVYLYDGANDPYGLDSVNEVDDWITCNKPWEGDYGWGGSGGSGGSGAGVAVASASCEPAYVNYCIPPVYAAGDLSCAQMYAQGISWIQLASIGWDPHGFDSEGDGWGCEG
ncbi:MAG: hypothetical protein ACKOWF_12880 [Chloroflexota bacterium]